MQTAKRTVDTSLTELLDKNPLMRSECESLVHIEKLLISGGLSAVKAAPTEQLARAYDDLLDLTDSHDTSALTPLLIVLESASLRLGTAKARAKRSASSPGVANATPGEPGFHVTDFQSTLPLFAETQPMGL